MLSIITTFTFFFFKWTLAASPYTLFDAFHQVTIERQGEQCEIAYGNVPPWLNGYFLRQVSGSVGKLDDPVPQRIENLKDAIGMGVSYKFEQGSCSFSSRYYRSLPFQVWNRNGKSLSNVGTSFWTLYSKTSSGADSNINRFRKYTPYSPNHVFWKLGSEIAAVSDGFYSTRVDPATMDNNGENFPFTDSGNSFGLDGLMFNNAGHATDDSTGTKWSAVYNANPGTGKTRLIIYQIVPTGNSAKRQIFAVKEFPQFTLNQCSSQTDTPVDKLIQFRDIEPLPGYIHDIAVTDNYVVLPVSSMLADYCFLFVYKYWPQYLYEPQHSFWFKWRPDKYSTVLLMNKASKRFYEVRIQPLFISHIVNAFEDPVTGTVVLDVLTSNDGTYMANCWSMASILNNNVKNSCFFSFHLQLTIACS